jgi:hypothetical protein
MLWFSAVLNCRADQEPQPVTAPTIKINYEDHVKPIFREHCLNCHNQNESKGALALDSFAALMAGGGSGGVVVEGDVESSRLFQLMAHLETPVMPPQQGNLEEEKLLIVKNWILGGLLERADSKVRKKKGISLTFSATGGKPEGPPPMPESQLRQPVIVSDRPATASSLGASPWAPLVAVGGQRQVLFYHAESGELLGVLPFPEGVPQSIRFSRDGGYVIVGGGEHAKLGIAALYDVKTGRRLARVGDELDVVLSADVDNRIERIALAGPQRIVRVFDLAGAPIFELKKHTDWVYAVAFSPDGVLLASADRSGGLHLWEAETGRFYFDLPGHKGAVTAIAWRPDGNVIASVGEDGTAKLWDAAEGRLLKSWAAHNGGVTDVTYLQDGRLVTSGKDKVVRLWDANGTQKSAMPAMAEPILEVAAVGDGSRVVGGDWAGTFRVWKTDPPTSLVDLVSNPPKLEQRVAKLAQQLSEGTTLLEQKQVALDASTRGLEEATGRSLAAEQALNEHRKELAGLQELSTQVSGQLKLALEQLAAKSSEQAELTSKKETIAATLVALVEQERLVTKSLTEAGDQLSEAGTELLEAEKAHSEVKGKHASLLKLVEDTKRTLDQAKEKLANEQDRSAAEQAIAQLEQELLAVRQRADETESLVKVSAEQIRIQEEKRSSAERNKEDTLVKLTEIAANRQTYDAESASVARKLATLTVPTQKLSSIVKDLEKQSAVTAADQTSAEGKVKKLTGEYDALQQTRNAAKQAQEAALKELNNIKASLDNWRAEHQLFVEELARFQGSRQRLQEAAEQIAASSKVAADRLLQPKSELQTLDGEKEKRQVEVDRLRAEIAQLQARHDELVKNLASLQETVDQQETAAANAQSDLELFQAAYGPSP